MVTANPFSIISPVIESNEEFFYILDSNQRFTYVNPPLLKLWTKELCEVIGKNFEELGYPSDLVHLHRTQLDEVLTGKIITGENNYTGPDGKTSFYVYTFVPVQDGNQKVIAIAGNTRNVTAAIEMRKQLEEKEAHFRSFAEAMPQMAFVADASGKIIYFNRPWYDYIGLSGTEGDGWKNLPIHHPDDLLPTIERWDLSLKTGLNYEIEYRLRRHDGQYFWHLGRAVPVRDSEGKIIYWFGTNTNIHEQKIQQERFHSDLTQSQDTNFALENQKLMRDVFVAGLSHDLRTPLTAAKLTAQTLMKKSTDPELVKLAHKISRNMDRADKMIRDMLDASRIDIGHSISLNLKEFEMVSHLKEIVKEFKETHGNRFNLIQEGELFGTWDCDSIKRVVENLLTNAIKYGDPFTPITVACKKLREDSIEITVHNYGTPISDEDIQLIFDVFKQSSKHVALNAGWGIGLTLVKGICEAHGGQVKVSSSKTEGTLFSIGLPLKIHKSKVETTVS